MPETFTTPPKPREKLISRGAESLEDAELLALLLGTGQPGRPVLSLACGLLDEFGSIAATLAAPWEQLRNTAGIGPARYAIFKATRELARRASAQNLTARPLLNDPKSVSDFLVAHLGGLGHEVFGVLFLDSRHRLIRFEQLFTGSLTQTSVYPREIAKRALQLNAAAIIAAHNHPSGVADPSRADQCLTTRLRQSLRVLEIELLDHLVVAGDRTVTVAEV
jgi:DNA repair protein RadC